MKTYKENEKVWFINSEDMLPYQVEIKMINPNHNGRYTIKMLKTCEILYHVSISNLHDTPKEALDFIKTKNKTILDKYRLRINSPAELLQRLYTQCCLNNDGTTKCFDPALRLVAYEKAKEFGLPISDKQLDDYYKCKE